MPDLRKMKLPARACKVPKHLQPTGIQLRYRAFLQQICAFAHQLVKERLYPRLPGLLGVEDGIVTYTSHADAKPRSVNRVMQQITEAFDRVYPQRRLERMAEQIAQQTSKHQKEQLFKQIKGALGVNLESIADTGASSAIAHFTAENVALIKTVPRDYFADVESHVLDAMKGGLRHEELADQLEERLGVSEDRAALIARDQVLSFQADLNEQRQQDLGITRYVWRTVEDERVREWHAERDGEIYSWDDPPGDPDDPSDGANPGDGINCRCYADPVVEDLLGE